MTLTQPANSLTAIVKTNNNGEWVRAGLQAGNPWNIRVKKGDLEGGINNVRVQFNGVLELPPIVDHGRRSIRRPKPGWRPRRRSRPPIAKATAEVEAAIKAGDFDLAITKYTEAAAALPECAVCYVRIGDLQYEEGSDRPRPRRRIWKPSRSTIRTPRRTTR